MTDLPAAIAAAREAVQELDGFKHPELADAYLAHCVGTLRDLLAALDAAQGEAVAWRWPRGGWADGTPWPEDLEAMRKVGAVPEYAYAAPQAPPAQPVVERYGDGVLVHWPEGMEQYVQVGDCVTGNLEPAAVPAEPFGMLDSQGIAHEGNSSNFAWLLEKHRAGKPEWGNRRLLYLAPPSEGSSSADFIAGYCEGRRAAYDAVVNAMRSAPGAKEALAAALAANKENNS